MPTLDTFPRIKNSLWLYVKALRVVAPLTRQGAPLEKNRRPDSRPIVNRITHYVKDNGLFQNYLQSYIMAFAAKNAQILLFIAGIN
jgi:hypothetical protein